MTEDSLGSVSSGFLYPLIHYRAVVDVECGSFEHSGISKVLDTKRILKVARATKYGY